MKNATENINKNTNYFQPTFFDTFPEIFNKETYKLIETEDEKMPFWAEDIPEELLYEEYDNSDNGEAVDM